MQTFTAVRQEKFAKAQQRTAKLRLLLYLLKVECISMQQAFNLLNSLKVYLKRSKCIKTENMCYYRTFLGAKLIIC